MTRSLTDRILSSKSRLPSLRSSLELIAVFRIRTLLVTVRGMRAKTGDFWVF